MRILNKHLRHTLHVLTLTSNAVLLYSFLHDHTHVPMWLNIVIVLIDTVAMSSLLKSGKRKRDDNEPFFSMSAELS